MPAQATFIALSDAGTKQLCMSADFVWHLACRYCSISQGEFHQLDAIVSKGAAQQVVTSGALPPLVIDMVPYRMKFAEKTSRLMSPFSKDETGHES